MNSLDEWWKNKEVYQKVLIVIGVVDLLILGVTFFYEKLVFFDFRLLNIIILFDMILIPALYLIMLCKQPISPEEYYLKNINDNYMYMDESLLTKIFEIRISNKRQSVFAYLFLFVTFTLTMSFNPEAYNYFKVTIGSGSTLLIAVGVIGILVLVFYTFGIDRLTLKELEILYKAKKKLRQLKERNISSPIQETSITNEDTHEYENNKAFSYQNVNSANQDKTQTIKNSKDIIALVEDAIKNKDASVIEKIEDKNHLKYMQKVVEVGILRKCLISSIPSLYIGNKGIILGLIAIGVSFFLVAIPIDNLSKITFPLGGVIIICGKAQWIRYPERISA